MNFDVSKAQVVPFSITESEINQNFLDWIIIGDNTPIDIACNTSIKDIEKQFYPIRIVENNYIASWSATSIWEHEEEYIEKVQKKVYINPYTYRESTNEPPFLNAPNPVPNDKTRPKSLPYKIAYKWFEEKRTKTVIDKVDHTSGSLNGKYSQIVVTLADTNPDLLNWLHTFSIDERIDKSDDIFSNINIMPLAETDLDAIEKTKSSVQAKAKEECKNEVPGTRYENFCVGNIKSDCKITVVLLPVYKITYEYEEKEYVSWFSGSTKDSACSNKKPQDLNLVAKKAILDNELEEKKAIRLKSGLISFVAVPIGALILLTMLGDLGVVALFVAIFFEIFYIRKDFLPKHTAVKECSDKINSHLYNLDEKRKKIARIVRQDNLTVDEQKARIKEIIES